MTLNRFKISPPIEPTLSWTLLTLFIEIESGKATIGSLNSNSFILIIEIFARNPLISPLNPFPKKSSKLTFGTFIFFTLFSNNQSASLFPISNRSLAGISWLFKSTFVTK